MEKLSFKRGCRGPVIEPLQQKLELTRIDGLFGKNTQAAVRNVQKAHAWMQTGDADKSVFEALGLQFPDEFQRCLNLTSVLEGTGFGDCNSRDIDGFGVTMGIVGFTSRTGEVQELLGKFCSMYPEVAIENIGADRFHVLQAMIATKASHKTWLSFIYAPDGYIKPFFSDFIHQLGKNPEWRQLQVSAAKIRYWDPSQVVAKRLRVTSMLGRGMLYDGFVQNGGWRDDHQQFFESQTFDGTERTLLRAIARSYAARATKQWQKDVLSRKLFFVDGAGIVHNEFFDSDTYAFEQL